MSNLRVASVVSGIVIGLLWFMPWVTVSFSDLFAAMDRPGRPRVEANFYQSGQHIGGLAYLLLAAAVGQAAAGWARQWQLAALLAGGGALIAIYYLLAFNVALRPALPILAVVFWGITILHWRAFKRETANR